MKKDKAEWLALAGISLPFLAGWMLVSPRRNVPVIDDWVYAWSVEHLLKSGELRVIDFSAIYPVTQVLWGAVFAWIAGFSFGALRLSTVVLAVCGCWALYLMLRELGVEIWASVLGALAVAWHPVYFALSFSFMTDVPFVSLASLSLYFYVSGLRRNSRQRLWWGGLMSVAAFLVRPIGVALPLTVLAGARWGRSTASHVDTHRDEAPYGLNVRQVLIPVATAMAVMVAAWVALPRVIGPLEWASIRLGWLRWVFDVPPSEYAGANLNVLFVSVFPFAPLLFGGMTRWRSAILAAVLSVVMFVLFALFRHHPPDPLLNWQTWSLQDIASRAMIGGDLKPSAWSARIMPTLRVIGVMVVSALVVGLVTRLTRMPRGALVLVAFTILNLVLLNAQWLYNDRYYLVLAPALVYVAAASLPSGRLARTVVGVGLALWAFIAVTGTRDMLATNAACARLASELEARGVPPSEIDAGYSVNGWRLYAHPENLPPDADRRYEVPFVTSKRETTYRIVMAPVTGYDVVQTQTLPDAWWQASTHVYLVRRQD